MTSPQSNQQHIPLDKGPYSVLYRIASFLPPASNYRLKQVSRNFTDAVQRLTENWVIPFIYCNQFQQTTHVGLFYFADLEVKLSTKPLQTPKVEIRTGKSYYKEVNHAQVADVVEAMVDFGKEEMELASTSCPFAQPVMVLVDSIPLARSVESYLIEKVRFNAPVTLLSTDAISSSSEHETETKKDDDNDSSQNKVFPSVFVKLLHSNQEHSETLEIAEKNKSTSQKLTPDLIRKSILSSVFAVIPEKLPAFRPEGDDDDNTSTSTIQAQNGTDAARHCGRPPFSVLFSHLPGTVEVHDVRHQAAAASMQKLKNETGRILKDSLGPLLRRQFGIRTSPSLMKILSDVNNFFDKDTQVFTLLKSDLPRYIGPNFVIDGISESIIESEEQQSPDCWKSYWSKRIFILGPPKKADEHPKFITACYGPDTPFSSNVVELLKQKIFRNQNDRLLVGENEDGVPVEITINSLHEYFRTEAQNHETSGLMSATYYDGMVPFRVSTATDKDILHVLSTFLVHHQDLSGNTRRLFVADDVSLGTIMSEDLYFPNPLIRKTNSHCPWKDVANNDNNNDIDNNSSSSKKKKSSNRLLTPWILVGEVGTFSDEHIEPEGLHVWVHLFIGTKLWFVERKTENKNNNNNTSADEENQEKKDGKDREWDMFFQRQNQTIVVPPNWRHFVLNITPTFAVAQNFVG